MKDFNFYTFPDKQPQVNHSDIKIYTLITCFAMAREY